MPTPPSAWLLTTAYFTVAHIKQPDEGNTVRLFQRIMIPHKGTLCVASVCVCFFLQLWSEILKMREENKQGLFVLNTWRRIIKDLSMDNHSLDLLFRGRLLSCNHGMVLINCNSAGHTAGSGFTVWFALRFNTLVNMQWLHVIPHQSSHYVKITMIERLQLFSSPLVSICGSLFD